MRNEWRWIAAALVIPAITARLLTDSFNRMILLSTLFGALSGLMGMYFSYYVNVLRAQPSSCCRHPCSD
jgi:ABC-type Mn2+/Zn2+ transport system permease subunit